MQQQLREQLAKIEQQHCCNAVVASQLRSASCSFCLIQELSSQQQQLGEQLANIEQQLRDCGESRVDLVALRGQLLERLAKFFAELQQQRQQEVVLMNKAAAEVRRNK